MPTEPPLSSAMLDAAVDLIGQAGARATVKMVGVSMYPTFRDVERLAVEFSPTEIRFGDVLVFRQRGKLVVHRLIQKPGGGERLRTRGDGIISLDPWLDPTDVLGRVLAVEYPGGIWRDVRAPRGWFYNRAVALHGLCWGLLGALATKLGGDRPRLALGHVDLALLRLVHALFYRAFNPLLEAPPLDAD